ncbi:hypothetical protein [Halorarum halobium]|uniref:hypothetical protein n=1 Tax=Halorarum halobium TaxID=3075121 RepID=UPI0028B19871|nr:hypothetical protein [Halobaculum sp. XH14]
MITKPPNTTKATTRIDCDNTGGYNVKPGVHTYEYCPFCGHPVLEGTEHELIVSLPS